MNKWNEIIRLCIEQIEKDEANAKKMAETRRDTVKIVHVQEIDFIIEYLNTILSILNITTTYDIKERLKDVIRLLNGLKGSVDNTVADINCLCVINKSALNNILSNIDTLIWHDKHIPDYPTAEKLEEIRSELKILKE